MSFFKTESGLGRVKIPFGKADSGSGKSKTPFRKTENILENHKSHSGLTGSRFEKIKTRYGNTLKDLAR
jgi:hypothetical protein